MKIALFSVGHQPYWGQFPGLLELLDEKTKSLEQELVKRNATVNCFGLVDTAQKAADTADAIAAWAPDIVMVHMATYASSATFAAIVQTVRCPFVLVALQPDARLDPATATTFRQLYNDDICSVPEFTGVAERLGHPVAGVIVGRTGDDPHVAAELDDWCRVAAALGSLKHARIGLMGHAMEHMFDMQADPTAVAAAFGVHVAMCEPHEILRELPSVTQDEIVAREKLILESFDAPDPGVDTIAEKLRADDLTASARASLALERFIKARSLDGLAYYFEGAEGSAERDLPGQMIVGNSLLIGQGFPMCGEFDIKTCLAMYIMDRIGAGGSFAEIHPIDFTRDTVLIGHDGPHHIKIAQGKPIIRSLKKFHGKPGHGASVEFSIKEGPITILSMGLTRKGFRFVVAEGESLIGELPKTGNTNTHASFGPDIRGFLERWSMACPTHHFALGVGHTAKTLKRIADALGIEFVYVS